MSDTAEKTGERTDGVRVVITYTESDGDGYDEVIPVQPGTPFVWKSDPLYHSPSLSIGIHPDDRPAHLGVYTSESVRSPPGYESHVERGYWNGPIEQGLAYDSEEVPLFGCEIWGRIMFYIEIDSGD